MKINYKNDELYALKNKYNTRLLYQISENIEPDCEDYYLAEIETKAHKYDLIQNQQKEFINYLLKEIENKRRKSTSLKAFERNVIPLKDVLQKYKSIIGE